MADNITLNSMSGGDTAAADDVGGIKYQRVKLALGADGAHDMDLDSGQQAKASSVPVAIASDQELKPGQYYANPNDLAEAALTSLLTDIKGRLIVNPLALTAVSDSVDVAKMSKGQVTTVHSAITATATSAEVDCTGFNGLLVHCVLSSITSGNWTVEVLNSPSAGGAFASMYDLTQNNSGAPVKMISPSSGVGFMNGNFNYCFSFRGVLDFVKIVATRTTDGTLTCKVQPVNF